MTPLTTSIETVHRRRSPWQLLFTLAMAIVWYGPGIPATTALCALRFRTTTTPEGITLTALPQREACSTNLEGAQAAPTAQTHLIPQASLSGLDERQLRALTNVLIWCAAYDGRPPQGADWRQLGETLSLFAGRPSVPTGSRIFPDSATAWLTAYRVGQAAQPPIPVHLVTLQTQTPPTPELRNAWKEDLADLVIQKWNAKYWQQNTDRDRAIPPPQPADFGRGPDQIPVPWERAVGSGNYRQSEDPGRGREDFSANRIFDSAIEFWEFVENRARVRGQDLRFDFVSADPRVLSSAELSAPGFLKRIRQEAIDLASHYTRQRAGLTPRIEDFPLMGLSAKRVFGLRNSTPFSDYGSFIQALYDNLKSQDPESLVLVALPQREACSTNLEGAQAAPTAQTHLIPQASLSGLDERQLRALTNVLIWCAAYDGRPPQGADWRQLGETLSLFAGRPSESTGSRIFPDSATAWLTAYRVGQAAQPPIPVHIVTLQTKTPPPSDLRNAWKEDLADIVIQKWNAKYWQQYTDRNRAIPPPQPADFGRGPDQIPVPWERAVGSGNYRQSEDPGRGREDFSANRIFDSAIEFWEFVENRARVRGQDLRFDFVSADPRVLSSAELSAPAFLKRIHQEVIDLASHYTRQRAGLTPRIEGFPLMGPSSKRVFSRRNSTPFSDYGSFIQALYDNLKSQAPESPVLIFHIPNQSLPDPLRSRSLWQQEVRLLFQMLYRDLENRGELRLRSGALQSSPPERLDPLGLLPNHQRLTGTGDYGPHGPWHAYRIFDSVEQATRFIWASLPSRRR